MLKRALLNIALILVIASLSVGIAFAQEHSTHWGYEGEEGPEHWGELSEEWEACSLGSAQSPVDLTGAVSVDLNNIEVNYADTAINIFNNGHTIQVNYSEGSSIVYNEVEYQLLQFHFHHPSEHTIDGVPADMEIHFVHRSEHGNLAVIGVMLMAGDEASAAYASVFDYLPAEAGEPEDIGMQLNAADLLPSGSTFYTYNGSLTTPPCTEIVRWLVMTEPITLSAEQIGAFSAIFDNNARPVTPLNERDLLVDAAG
jgi:carbonic anhydrase